MKKHLIAVAVAAAVAVPAVAQVSVSGAIDVTAQRTNKLTTRAAAVTTQVNTSNTGGGSGAGVADVSADGWATSELVFQATENLGGGLKATARFSQNFTNNSFGVAPGRDKYIDVAGGFGSVRLGRFNGAVGGLNAYSGAGSTNPGGDLNNMTNGGARILGAATAGASFERNSGLVQFTSPSFSGLTFNALYGDNSTDTTSTANSVAKSKITAFGAAYTAGPLKVEFASGQRKNRTASAAAVQGRAIFFNSTSNSTVTATTNSTTGAVGTVLNSTSGASAALGTGFLLERTLSGTAAAALTAVAESSFATIQVAGVAAQLATDATHDFDWLGASYNFGVATVMASHSRRKAQSNTVLDTAQATLHDININSVGLMIPLGATTLRASMYTGKDSRGVTAADDVKLSGQQISAIYSLSKRTYLYAAMGESDVARDTTAGTAAERKEKTTGLGLVHSF